MLWYQSGFSDPSSVDHHVTTPQGAQQRPDDVLAAHVSDLASSVRAFGPVTGSPPLVVLPTADPVKVSSYIGQDGIRHATITTQGPDESEAQWQARHDAAHALLVAAFPPA